MACAGMYDCPRCGGAVIVGPKEIIEHYGGPHVCDRARQAEHEYLSNPRAEFHKSIEEAETA